MDGWMGTKKVFLQKKTNNYFSKNKPKMAGFLKFKCLITIKLNFKGGQFYEKNY